MPTAKKVVKRVAAKATPKKKKQLCLGCKGTGLVDKFTLCQPCNGSGKI